METRAPIRRKWWRVIGILVAGLVALWAVSLPLISKWVFGSDKIRQELGDATSGTVRFHSFRHLYFPHPGFVAEGVTIWRKDSGSAAPLISVERLTIISTFSGVLRKHVSLMKADGLQVTPVGKGWPGGETNSAQGEQKRPGASRSTIVIERLVADNALLQIRRRKPLNFRIQHFVLENLGGDGPMPFRVELTNPMPPGEISASGKLGPWRTQQRDETPVSGTYSFRHADLSALGGIGGLLTSDGHFQGSVRRLQVAGETDTPEFEVTTNHHRFPLRTHFQAEVNATNGDVVLQQVDARLAETKAMFQGTVMPDAQLRRAATLDFVVAHGRIQEILYPFIEAPRSPVNGAASCRGRVILPSGMQPFRQRVYLDAMFAIEDARFTSPQTRAKLNQASERARGHADDGHPENVISRLQGHVALKDGVAKFSQLSFDVPGASAIVHGTYNVLNERINLHGTVRLQAKISDTTSGLKSFVLKAISPFLKKKDKPQEPLPVAVTGTYDHPQYSVSVTKDNQHRHGI